MSTFEVIRGVEGCCLALDDTRIAGPKPWGGGTVIHAWKTDKEYKAVDTHSRWHELFGTPEKAARVIAALNNCRVTDCIDCWARGACRYYGCGEDYDALLEWLGGDAE